MIGVMIIPTGIGAEIGGHAGDANPAAKLMASCCDTLIVHPNVVNASDLNEMTENMLYVEGSILDRFLERKTELKPVLHNRILVVANNPIRGETLNAVSAARVTVGVEAEIMELHAPLRMVATTENGCATGIVTGWEELVDQVRGHDFDALAVHSPIEVDRDCALGYYKTGGINPWGGVEAKASRIIADAINKPVAHAPLEATSQNDEELYFIFNEKVDPRIAPEAISVSYLHCILKGLWRAPRIGRGLSVSDVDFMVSPYGCVGRPHRACLEAGIPIIAVEENKTCLSDPGADKFITAKNYMEAAGIVMSMKAGISFSSVRRPLSDTVQIRRENHGR